ncbi:putative transcriptional regulatory protein （MerR family&|uniref:Transcriptional regulatory protein (MerR family) n=1 Tax=Magnetospirillum gryphiswaldense (strain DSM 6361 / JCM 21280 / NBRC 15271 / MSR-1) TaxID=431944 RepID=V6F268_MAGGM|nr:MerR family transcriptional regulator [Magnetospirillum gryphiswaldense]CDK98371.1 putative transcriptional regulatory protein \
MTGDGDVSSGRRSNGKSESAFRTISEVADDLDVPQHVLRFWESKFPQVKPLKRGGGRRYYRPEDVALLRRIRDLLYSEGYTIKGVQKLLREGGHKDAPAASAAPAGDEPELQLDLPPQADDIEEDDFTIMDDGEEDDHQVMALEAEMAAKPAAEAGLRPEIRQELALLLDELEQMRSLLRPKQR